MKTLLSLLVTGFLVGQYVSGLNRICIYQTPRGERAITIEAFQVCPVRIKVGE